MLKLMTDMPIVIWGGDGGVKANDRSESCQSEFTSAVADERD